MTRNIIDLYDRIHRQMPGYCTQTYDTKSRGNICVKETNSEWPA